MFPDHPIPSRDFLPLAIGRLSPQNNASESPVLFPVLIAHQDDHRPVLASNPFIFEMKPNLGHLEAGIR